MLIFPVLLQFGSYFGYSVEVQDLDKNGYDDIIVGAPFFSNFGTDNMYETGRVYIFYQNSRVRISSRCSLTLVPIICETDSVYIHYQNTSLLDIGLYREFAAH